MFFKVLALSLGIDKTDKLDLIQKGVINKNINLYQCSGDEDSIPAQYYMGNNSVLHTVILLLQSL